MSRKNELSNELITKYSDLIKLHKKVLLIEKDRNKLNVLVDSIINQIYENTNKSLYVIELNFENSVKLGKLKKNVKDFLGNKSIFVSYPKMLLVRNLDLSNKNVIDVYSKIVSMSHDVLLFVSSASLNNISKSVLINSHIIWNKTEPKTISDGDFYTWINNISVSLDEDAIIKYLNTKLYDCEDIFDALKEFNEITESKTTVFRDECFKLMLKISREVY
jgi:hypothetical protein